MVSGRSERRIGDVRSTSMELLTQRGTMSNGSIHSTFARQAWSGRRGPGTGRRACRWAARRPRPWPARLLFVLILLIVPGASS